MANSSEAHSTSIIEYTRAKGTIHSFPVVSSNAKDFVQSLVTNDGIDIRVEWDGCTSSLGRFDVRVDTKRWQSCPNIDISAMNDLVSPKTLVAGKSMTVRMHRGPEHVACAFQARVIPIAWLAKHKPGATAVPACYTAERGVDYNYDDSDTSADRTWQLSSLDDGVQRLSLTLQTGRAYELWVRLQDPNNVNHWLEQDPIVRTDHGGSN